MTRWIPAIAPGVVFENVGDQTLVLVGNPPQVVRLSPEASELLTLIQQSPGREIEQTPALRQLVDLGVVEDTSPSTLSRRNVLQLSAVAGAVGLSTVLLPKAAMASSTESLPFSGTGTYVSVPNPPFSTRWDFTIAKSDFPDVGLFDYSGLTIGGGGPYSGGGGTEFITWGSFDGPYTGDVEGTFTDEDTGDVYTVTFSPAV